MEAENLSEQTEPPHYIAPGQWRSKVRGLLPRRQIAFGNDAFVPFRYVLYAVTRLYLIVGCWHEVADLVISRDSIMNTAWGEMDCLTDGEFVRQICLLQVEVEQDVPR
jgi:hypothetical protein